MTTALLLLLACPTKGPQTMPDTEETATPDSPGDDSEPPDSPIDTTEHDTADSDSPVETGDSGYVPPASGAIVLALDGLAQKIIPDESTFGLAIEARAGDLDGDGISDLIVADVGIESVHWFGPSLSTAATFGDADTTYDASEQSRYGTGAGTDLAILGDTDGDGQPDLLIGASNMQDETHNDGDGGAYVATGGLTGDVDLVTGATAKLWGNADGERTNELGWGSYVLAPGDVNGDGLADIVVAAAAKEHQLALVHGPAVGDVELLDSPLRYSETSIDGVDGLVLGGDADGDGLPEALIGTYTLSSPSGGAFLFSLVESGELSFTDATATWTDADGIGCHRALLGDDVNNDGYSDLFLATTEETTTESSLARVWYGPVSGDVPCDTFDIEVRDLALQRSVSASAGDIDGDGHHDFAFAGPIGELYGRDNDGFTTVYLGPLAGTVDASDADYTFTADAEDELTGVDLTGDFDADGLNDLVIVAIGDDDAGTDAGAVWIVYGNRL